MDDPFGGGKGIKGKEYQNGNVTDWPQSPISPILYHTSEWGAGRSQEWRKVVSRKNRWCGGRYFNMFLSTQSYFSWLTGGQKLPKLSYFACDDNWQVISHEIFHLIFLSFWGVEWESGEGICVDVWQLAQFSLPLPWIKLSSVPVHTIHLEKNRFNTSFI